MSIHSLSLQGVKSTPVHDPVPKKLEKFLKSRTSRNFVWEMANIAMKSGYLTKSTEITDTIFPDLCNPYWDPILYKYKDKPAPIYWGLNSNEEALLLVMQLKDTESEKHWTACFLYYEFDAEAEAYLLSTPFSSVPREQMVENFKLLLKNETVAVASYRKTHRNEAVPVVNLRLKEPLERFDQMSPCQLLTELYKDNALDKKQAVLDALPQQVRYKLFFNLHQLNQEPSEFSELYGRAQVFCSLPILEKAIAQIASEIFRSLDYNQHNSVSWGMLNSLGDWPPPRFCPHNNFNWAEDLAKERPLLLLEQLHRSLKNQLPPLELPISSETKQALDTWRMNGGASHLAVEEITNFFANHYKTYLDLSYFSLTNFSPILTTIPLTSRLTDLNLSNNQLSSLPSEISYLENLNGLDLHNNQLSSLPFQFGSLKKLCYLNLSKNHFVTLPSLIGNLENLSELFLAHNKLSSLPRKIGNLKQLFQLDLKSNRLRTLPKTIGNLTNLDKLNLQDNLLTSLPQQIGNLNLYDLYLAHNQLTTLPETIQTLSRLNTLDLRHNAFQTFPPPISYLLSLDDLLFDIPFDIHADPDNASPQIRQIYAGFKLKTLPKDPNRFQLNPAISGFNLDALLQPYQTERQPTELDQFLDWADIPNDNTRDDFNFIINQYLVPSNYQETVVKNLLGVLTEYFHRQRASLIPGTPAEDLLKQQFVLVYNTLVDASSNCVDQVLTQIQPVILDILAESDPTHQAASSQTKIFNRTALALCHYQSNLLKEILVDLYPDEKHMADLERLAIQTLAQNLHWQGSIFLAGSAFPNYVKDAEARIDKVIKVFIDQYRPIVYLFNELQTYHGELRLLRNEIFIWANAYFQLDEEGGEQGNQYSLNRQISEDYNSQPVSEGGNLTDNGTRLLMNMANIITFDPAESSQKMANIITFDPAESSQEMADIMMFLPA